jgi:hypothetical protein
MKWFASRHRSTGVASGLSWARPGFNSFLRLFIDVSRLGRRPGRCTRKGTENQKMRNIFKKHQHPEIHSHPMLHYSIPFHSKPGKYTMGGHGRVEFFELHVSGPSNAYSVKTESNLCLTVRPESRRFRAGKASDRLGCSDFSPVDGKGQINIESMSTLRMSQSNEYHSNRHEWKSLSVMNSKQKLFISCRTRSIQIAGPQQSHECNRFLKENPLKSIFFSDIMRK